MCLSYGRWGFCCCGHLAWYTRLHSHTLTSSNHCLGINLSSPPSFHIHVSYNKFITEWNLHCFIFSFLWTFLLDKNCSYSIKRMSLTIPELNWLHLRWLVLQKKAWRQKQKGRGKLGKNQARGLFILAGGENRKFSSRYPGVLFSHNRKTIPR